MDALTAEVVRSQAPSTQSLLTKAIERGAKVELRFEPKTEMVSVDLVFAGGQATQLFAATMEVGEDNDANACPYGYGQTSLDPDRGGGFRRR